MESVTIDGVEYIKASVLAKRYRYTADYIGQLCRGRKVDAKLVGRTWYVNTLSLDSHKHTRHKKEEAEKTIKNNTKEAKSRLDVQAVEARKPARPIQNAALSPEANQKNFARRIDWKPLRYEVDNQDLLPNLRPNIKKEGSIKINLAEASNLKIESPERPTKYISSELPVVSLTGRLKVTSLDTDLTMEADSNDDDISINKAPDEDYSARVKNLAVKSSRSPKLTTEPTHTNRVKVEIRQTPKVDSVTEIGLPTLTGLDTKNGPGQNLVNPKTTATTNYRSPNQFKTVSAPRSTERVGWLEWGLRIFLVFALLLLVAVAMLERSVFATSQAFDSSLEFHLPN